MEHGGRRSVWAFLTGPYALFLLVLLLVPFANIAVYSLHPYSPTKVFLPELTFDNYRKIFDLYYVRLFGRTLRLGLITTAVSVVLGYPLAYWLARARPRWQAAGLFLLIMPLMVSAVIRVFGWIVILGRKGLVNQALVTLGLEPVKLLFSETAVVIGLVNIFVPFMVLPVMAAIERISPSLEEAAQNLGASWYRMFGRVILPLSLPGLCRFFVRSGKAVLRPVACDQVRGARGRGQGIETLAELGGLPPSRACVSQRLEA